MQTQEIQKILQENGYVGRGVLMGLCPSGRRAAWKKAIVKLAPESKAIEFFEGMV